MKEAIAESVGGVHNNTITMHNGIIDAIMYGVLLPHLVFVRSDKAPNSGSLIAFQMLHNINPSVIRLTSKPTTA